MSLVSICRRAKLTLLNMRILLLHPSFFPDPSPASRLFTELAVDLAESGHEIEVLTGTAEDGSSALFLSSVRMRRLYCGACQPDKRWSCRIGYARFLFSAGWRIFFQRQPDLLLVPSPPPLLMLLAYMLHRLRGTHYIAWALEVEPTLLQPVTGNIVRRFWRKRRIRLIQTALRHARRIVTCSEDLRAGLRGALAPFPDSLDLLPIWADGRQLAPIRAEHNVIIRGLDLEGKFILTGFYENLGAEGLELLARAGRQLTDAEQPHHVIVGRQPLVRARKPKPAPPVPGQIDWIAPVSLAREGHLYSSASLGLLQITEAETHIRFPFALPRFLAAGTPILLLGSEQSAVSRFLRTHGCGWTIPAGNDAVLAERLRLLRQSPEILAAARRNARRAFEASFERKHGAARWRLLLESEASIQAHSTENTHPSTLGRFQPERLAVQNDSAAPLRTSA